MSQYDAPNQQAVGLDPPWVEGSGGEEGEPAPPPEVDPQQQTSDLDEMTKAELLEHAKTLGVSPANNDMTKEELRKAIDEHQG